MRKPLAGHIVRGAASARVNIDGRPYLNFFGSGYLALSNEPEIREAVRCALEDGVPFSRHLNAAHEASDPVFDAIEAAGAAACATEASVYFASGYLVGQVCVASLERPFDVIVLDELAHHSLQDAARITGKRMVTFRHADSESLSAALRLHVGAKQVPLLMTDGVFPTSGEVAPLADYAVELAPYGGLLLVDESHSFGVVGENGRGAVEYCGVEDVAVAGATLSKAYCAQGAILGCSREVAARLRVTPPIGGANAGSPLSAIAASASLKFVSQRPRIRANLLAKTGRLRALLRGIGLEVIDSPAPIVSFRHGSRVEMQALQHRAFSQGVYLHHSTYIGAGMEGVIRCAVFADHTEDDFARLIEVLE